LGQSSSFREIENAAFFTADFAEADCAVEGINYGKESSFFVNQSSVRHFLE
jgi:hypothetical protein